MPANNYTSTRKKTKVNQISFYFILLNIALLFILLTQVIFSIYQETKRKKTPSNPITKQVEQPSSDPGKNLNIPVPQTFSFQGNLLSPLIYEALTENLLKNFILRTSRPFKPSKVHFLHTKILLLLNDKNLPHLFINLLQCITSDYTERNMKTLKSFYDKEKIESQKKSVKLCESLLFIILTYYDIDFRFYYLLFPSLRRKVEKDYFQVLFRGRDLNGFCISDLNEVFDLLTKESFKGFFLKKNSSNKEKGNLNYYRALEDLKNPNADYKVELGSEEKEFLLSVFYKFFELPNRLLNPGKDSLSFFSEMNAIVSGVNPDLANFYFGGFSEEAIGDSYYLIRKYVRGMKFDIERVSNAFMQTFTATQESNPRDDDNVGLKYFEGSLNMSAYQDSRYNMDNSVLLNSLKMFYENFDFDYDLGFELDIDRGKVKKENFPAKVEGFKQLLETQFNPMVEKICFINSDDPLAISFMSEGSLLDHFLKYLEDKCDYIGRKNPSSNILDKIRVEIDRNRRLKGAGDESELGETEFKFINFLSKNFNYFSKFMCLDFKSNNNNVFDLLFEELVFLSKNQIYFSGFPDISQSPQGSESYSYVRIKILMIITNDFIYFERNGEYYKFTADVEKGRITESVGCQVVELDKEEIYFEDVQYVVINMSPQVTEINKNLGL